MATVKAIKNPIKSHPYVSDSIAYILSPENRSGDEKCFRADFLNCFNTGISGLSQQFCEIRKVFRKDSDILAHHYVQSFSPNEEISPELVHQIGVELAQKMAPGFQVIVSTHVDKDHLHNHILINSVSFETGLKWKGNASTLNAMRSESDMLCREYGMTTIKKHSGLRGIDQATQKLAEKGKSWKVALCKALDEAVFLCIDQEQFVAFMKRKGFEITRYTDRHITFQKIGEQKKIRADTLAKQFGDKYTKEYLEKKMGYYCPPITSDTPQLRQTKTKWPVPYVSEFERIEKRHFADNPPPITPDRASDFQQRIKKSKNPFFLLLKVIHKILFRQNQKIFLDADYEHFHKRIKKQKRYKIKNPDLNEILKRYEKNPAVAGNILYRDLVNSQGNNLRVRLSLSAVPKLYAYPFFFSARLYSDYALVTIKERDKELFKKIFESANEAVIKKHNDYYTPKADYQALKERAAQFGVKVEFLMIEPEQLASLNDEKDRYVPMPSKDGKIRLAFLPQNKDYILHALYPDQYKSKEDTLFSVARNSKVNTRIKSEALLRGKKLCSRTLTREQVEQLAADIPVKDNFAVFGRKTEGENHADTYNIAFKDEDTEKIEMVLRKPRRRR